MATLRKISSGWPCFDEEESDNKVVCRLCKQKFTDIHLDVNLQGERGITSNTRQTSYVNRLEKCLDLMASEYTQKPSFQTFKPYTINCANFRWFSESFLAHRLVDMSQLKFLFKLVATCILSTFTACTHCAQQATKECYVCFNEEVDNLKS